MGRRLKICSKSEIYDINCDRIDYMYYSEKDHKFEIILTQKDRWFVFQMKFPPNGYSEGIEEVNKYLKDNEKLYNKMSNFVFGGYYPYNTMEVNLDRHFAEITETEQNQNDC